MGQALRKANTEFTWADYRSWPDSERWELIDGHAYAMSPSPGARHQHVCVQITSQLEQRLRGQPCRVFAAPMDVKLAEEDVVQPDVLVVCDPSQIKPTHIEGPPALIVEVLSPSSVLHDRQRKLNLYARRGVREFWLVTQYPGLVEVFVLERGRYHVHQNFAPPSILRSATFPKLGIRLRPVFDFPLQPGDEPPIVRERPAVYRRASDPD